MKKFITLLLCLLAAGLIFWSLFRDILARSVLEKVLQKTMGLTVTISDIDTSFDWSRVKIKGLTVLNPKDFPTDELAYFSRLEFLFDPGELIFKRKLHLYYVGLWLERFNVIKRQDGSLNLKSVGTAKPAPPPQPQLAGERKIMVNMLQLDMRDVYYLDYTAGKQAKVTRYNINQVYAFEHIDTLKDIADVIWVYALSETKLFKTLNITLGPLSEGIKDVVVAGAKTIGDTVKGVMQVPLTIIGK